MRNRCNVEVYQAKIKKKYGTKFNILVLYCAQPLAVFFSWIV
jgi:heterodisulfide reductase subunit B